jgi:hypothetical protein
MQIISLFFYFFLMVAKSIELFNSEAKSKRGTAREKYKIIKRVAQHKREQRKAAKNKKKGPQKQVKIPNDFPLKQELLEQAQMVRDAQKEVQKTIVQKEEPVEVEREITFEKEYLLMKQLVEECDAVLHVIDARDPVSGRMVEVEPLCKNPILVLSKIGTIILTKTWCPKKL